MAGDYGANVSSHFNVDNNEVGSVSTLSNLGSMVTTKAGPDEGIEARTNKANAPLCLEISANLNQN